MPQAAERPAPGQSVPAPTRRRRAQWFAAGVALASVAILAASAGSALRPVPLVRVRPVLFDAAASAAPTPRATPTTRTVQAPGWLEADPYTIAATALTDGVVAEILVLEGQSVTRGQPVARLVREDAQLALARAEADRRAAEADLDRARAALAAAQSDWDQPVERERAVAAARAELARVDAELARLPALIAAEAADAERLAEELARTEQAHRSGAANEIEAVVARKRLDAALATVDALERQRPVLEAQRDTALAERHAAERHADLRTAERLALDAARADLARAEAELARRAAARDEAALRLERTEIRAPIAGFVQRRLKAPGDKVMLAMDDPHSAHLVHLYDPARLQARVDVPLADAAEIHLDQPCEVVVEVLPDRTFRGVVDRITHQADLQKNTLQVKVRLLDPLPILKPDMLTRVRFLGAGDAAGAPRDRGSPTVLVPEDAIEPHDGADAVRVVRDRRAGRGVLETVPVTVHARAEGWATVTADLRPGDLLALNAHPDAARVRIAQAEDTP